jgi:hypothetical protein
MNDMEASNKRLKEKIEELDSQLKEAKENQT